MSQITENELKEQLTAMVESILAAANLEEDDIFVLGCSTSEIIGGVIGKNSSAKVGQWVIETLKGILDPLKVNLAVQGGEHLNRA